MACYDYTQQKIFGCEEHTLIWWHEKGHEQLHKSGLVAELGVLQSFLMLGILCFLCIGDTHTAQICLLGFVLILLSDEIFAWIIGINGYKKDGKKAGLW